MKSRCTNLNDPSFFRYGKQSITICERWLTSFSHFLADMGERPEGTTIDRINNKGNYEPSNCRWATSKEQANNRSDNIKIGGFSSLEAAASETGISIHALRKRVQKGWSEQRALSSSEDLRATSFGNYSSVVEAAAQTGIPISILYDRRRLGWSAEKALSTPIKQCTKPIGGYKTLVEAAKQSGIPYRTLVSRLAKGWSEEQALTQPVKVSKIQVTNPITQ
jgi:hypothetical protein